VTQLHSDRRPADVALVLIDSLMRRLKELDVLKEEDIQKIVGTAAEALQGSSDQATRDALNCLRDLYQPPSLHPRI
jgi:hypothetical protein